MYNSQGILQELHQRLSQVFGHLNASWELILVNDCSRDKSWTVMEQIARQDKRVTIINLMNNFGQHNAIMCGLAHVQGNYVITMDDDLQHPPEEIVKLAGIIHAGDYLVVYGQHGREHYGVFRDFCAWAVHKALSKITGSGYMVSSFRMMHHGVVEQLITFTQYNVMIDVLLKNIVTPRQIGHCRVRHAARKVGKSNYSFTKLFGHAVNMVFNYTLWPLRLAIVLGLVFAALSFALGLFFLLYYVTYGIGVSGWTSLILSVTFFSGLILFVLGIIGEYVGRTFLNINQKPQYIIREVKSK